MNNKQEKSALAQPTWHGSDARRRAVYEVLEHGAVGPLAGFAVSRAIVVLILVNLLAIVLESVPQLSARFAFWFDAVEVISLVVFTVEYLLRLWVAVEHA